jgi:hypothetical protein
MVEKATSPARALSGRLRWLVIVLALTVAATAYLQWRHWANEHQQFGPLSNVAAIAALDPELAARPGVAELHKLGSRFEFDASDSAKPITELYLTSTTASDAELAFLKSWTSLRILDLSGTNITDAGLRHLQDLTALEALYLGFTKIRGDELKVVAKLPRLELLDLSKTQVSDATLPNVRELQSLHVLSLIEDSITDEGMKSLAALTNLRRLDLTGTQVTDAGLVHLQGLTRLEQLNLYGTYVTKPKVTDLCKEIPGLRVSTSD